MTKLERILVALDHSPGLELVIDYACAIARGVGATLTVLHVYEPPNELVGMVPGATVAAESFAEHHAGAELLDRATARVQSQGLASPDRILERGTPASHAILSHTRLGRFDLLVMGTHGRKGVARLVLGSTAEQVLRDAPCPVLTVHLPHE